MRTSKQLLAEEIEEEISKLLPELLSDIGSASDVKSFLTVFLSKNEREVLAKRIAIMYWLHKGRKYNEIKDELKVSSATIATYQETIKRPEFAVAFKVFDANDWAIKITEKIKGLVGK